MKRQVLPVSLSLAALIGAAHTYLTGWAWACISIYSPLPHWLLSHGVEEISLHGLLLFSDFLTNILLCIPAAYLLCKLRPSKLWAYLIAALLPGLLWQYRLVLGDIDLLQCGRIFLPGVLLTVLPLPVTALVIRRLLAVSSPEHR